MNGTQETTESINTNNWPIRTSMQNRMHNSGCGRCETKTTATNYLESNSGKYICFLVKFLKRGLLSGSIASNYKSRFSIDPR